MVSFTPPNVPTVFWPTGRLTDTCVRANGAGGAHLFESREPEDPADAAADAEAEAAGFGKAAEVVGNSEL